MGCSSLWVTGGVIRVPLHVIPLIISRYPESHPTLSTLSVLTHWTNFRAVQCQLYYY